MKSKITELLSKFDKNFYNILLWFLVVLNIAPILAPIFAWMGLTLPAQAIYFVYSFFCHQFDWRSLHIHDFQYAWCVRDTFIWLNILVAAVITKKYKIKGLKWYWLIPFLVPIALDGGIQTIATILGIFNSEPTYISTNLTRMITGSIFGIGFGFWIMPGFRDNTYSNDNRARFPFKRIVFLSMLFILNIVIYILLIQLWSISSIKYMPSNFLDYSVKTPANTNDWFTRRGHAV